jgi:hypothetical protein
MSGRQLTQSEYALQHIVVSFVEVLSQLEELGLTHTYQDVFRFCELESIGYLAVRYLTSTHHHSRSGPRSGYAKGKYHLHIRRGRTVDEI